MSSTKKENAALAETEQGNLLHLSGITFDDHLWRTTRFDSGSWSSFEDVEDKAGKVRVPRDVSLQSLDYDLHFCVVDYFGGLSHAVRHLDGSWQRFNNLKAAAGSPGAFVKVALGRAGGSHGGQLHVCGITGEGRLWHTFRRSDLSWQSFHDVEGAAGERGAMEAVACAGNPARELHVCAVSTDGHLWHTIRRADSTWVPFGDVEAQAGDRGRFVDVDCTVINNQLHVCGITDDHRLWHTMRRTDGSWTPFFDVETRAGERGDLHFIAISESYAGELEVVAINHEAKLWHTIRRADGSWVPFIDVEGRTGERGNFRTVSIHGLYVAP